MRILVAQIPMPQNRFLVDLNAELTKRCSLHHSSDDFWEKRGEFDLVHLHFPEYLTYPVERAYVEGLKDELITEVESRLRWWAERTRLIVTRHVLLPHDALEDPQWEKMYRMFYRYADGVVHFAQASVEEFRQRYRDTEWHRGQEPVHTVIPHHNYCSLPNTVGREEARRRLGISQKARVMLVFGAIRNEAEKKLILQTFRRMRVRQKLLLISRWKERLPKISWVRLKYWVRDLTRLYYRLHPDYKFNYGFVEEPDTQLYLNAADVLFIPRLKVLNSGNITLGMTFGRVVVGPDSWDVGQLLRETGNPVFDSDRPETAPTAMEEGFRLRAEGRLGAANQELALREWGADQCAALYLQFYRDVAANEPQ